MTQAVTGIFHVPVIPFAYSNVPVPYSVQDFQNVLFSPTPQAFGRPYSVKTYYEELSHGLIGIQGQIFNPITVDSSDTYYQDGCNGIGVTNTCPHGGQRFGAMLIALLDSISKAPGGDTVWNQFDNDGPDGIPNSGDDDGLVDVVAFIHPTVDGACGAPGIWSHRWVISGWNGGSPYVTRTPRRDRTGNPIPGQFLKIDNYTIQSQLGGPSACNGGAIMPIGTMAHETGHIFGLPDLYDTDQASRTQGIGEWGLMGSGNFARPYSPASYDAWSMNEMGWVAVTNLPGDRIVATGARQLTDTVFVAPTGSSSEYFLLENRQAIQSDSAQMNPIWVKHKAPGLLIWHIDLNRITQGRASNTVNTGAVQGVALMEADGLNKLRTPGSSFRGGPGDPYPGSSGNSHFGLMTNPAAVNNTTDPAGFAIDHVSQLAGGVVQFRYVRRDASLFQASLVGATIQVNGQVLNRYTEIIPAGDTVSLSVDTLQSLANGRTQARFLAWSNGGRQVQTLTSGVRPDTVTATFTASHRVSVIPQGGGSVTANVQGDLTAGIFVPAGSAVTLTANTPSGLVFAGWQGDTVATGPTLQLPMQHPYDVAAIWLQQQQIPLADAADELLGTPKLTQSQKDYLDRLGNRNGGYDLGDYLALLYRSGASPSPALLQLMAPRQGTRRRAP